MLQFSDINFLAFGLAVLVNIIIGAIWYSPLGFSKQWSKLSGVDMMKLPKDVANKAIAFVAFGSAVQALALATIITSLNITKPLEGLLVGLLIWAGFIASTTIGDTLYARRGWKYWWINASFFLVTYSINSILLSIWR